VWRSQLRAHASEDVSVQRKQAGIFDDLLTINNGAKGWAAAHFRFARRPRVQYRVVESARPVGPKIQLPCW
jgi:hypothetical protein